MELALTAVACLIIGFIAGALVFRKHSKEGEKIVGQAKELRDQLQKQVDDLKQGS